MTTKAYLVSWIAQGKIIWTPLEKTAQGFALPEMAWQGPLRALLQYGAEKSETVQFIQRIFDPSLAALGDIKKIVSLTAGFSAASAGLQIVSLAGLYRLSQNVQRIDQKVKVLGGKFELHFLDRSVEHFLRWHEGQIGVLHSAAVALEEDCFNALQELVGNKSLKIPGYLRLKIQGLSEALEEYSRFLYATLHNGSLPVLDNERIEKWVSEGKNIQKALPSGAYVSQKTVLEKWVHQLETNPKWKPENDNTLLCKALDRGTIERTLPVVHLALQISQVISLTTGVEHMLAVAPNTSIIVEQELNAKSFGQAQFEKASKSS